MATETTIINCNRLPKVNVLLALLSIPFFSFCTQNFEDPELGLKFNVTKNTKPRTVEITEFNHPKQQSIEIPPVVNYKGMSYIVTSIGYGAFDGMKNLSSIEIPQTVERIQDRAFRECSILESITIPEIVTEIGIGAFEGCSSLTSIYIPQNVNYIGGEAFNDCSNLATINVAKANSYYDSRDSCNAIIKTSSNTLIFGSNGTVIPNTITQISPSAFMNCKELSSVVIPNSVTYIDGYTFKGCTSLTSVILSNATTSIGEKAFEGCSSLSSIIIPNTVTQIGENAFKGCTSLTSITIPASVTSIAENAFEGCSNLASIIIDKENSKYDSRNNCNAIIETLSNKLIFGCKNTIIPNTVNKIADEAFLDCNH